MMLLGHAFQISVARAASFVWLVPLLGVLVGCAGGGQKPKPVELAANVPKNVVRLAWSSKINPIDFALDITSSDSNKNDSAILNVASSDGIIVSFDAKTGRELWRAPVGKTLAAGVGADGVKVAVVTQANELVALENGRELWRQKLTTSSFTAPMVSGGKVFVLGSDRSVSAFDLTNGGKLWTQKRSTEILTLRQAGVLLMVSDTLVTSNSGRLIGMNPLDGSVRWETPIAVARGTNDVERLVDLVGRVSKLNDIVCARAFRVSVGCINTFRGQLVWSQPAIGVEGVHGDNLSLFGTEADGKVIAWSRTNGERLWVTDFLLNRNLSAPAVLEKAIAVGDSTGLVHFLSKTDGSPLNRITTDGSAMAAAPVVIGNTLVVVTRNGGIFGFTVE
jgi:outer membrane protein assembly factor BamB